MDLKSSIVKMLNYRDNNECGGDCAFQQTCGCMNRHQNLENDLEQKKREIRELNITLRTLLIKQYEHIEEVRKSCMSVIRERVQPHIDLLETRIMDPELKECLKLIRFSLLGKSPGNNTLLMRDFSPREIQIINFIINGKSSKEIAHALRLAPKTIHSHREQIRRKLGITNRGINLRERLIEHLYGREPTQV
jgi:DNA-binding NarL/FixJ family response regulator